MTKKKRKQTTLPLPPQPKPVDPRLIRMIARMLRDLAEQLHRLAGD